MTGERVLIAALSGRALAQSARRAGYLPLVADCYGDEDMRSAADDSRRVLADDAEGFDSETLVTALDSLAAKAKTPPIGVVLGAGFEGSTELMTRLAGQFGLIGTSPEAVARSKNPQDFFPTLARLGIPHPETRLDAPANPSGWLMKRIGASGGAHIEIARSGAAPKPNCFYQRKAPGEAVSVLGIVGPASAAFGFSRQWLSPVPESPYRYGGATGPLTLEPDLEALLIETSLAVAREFALAGVVSFDYLVRDGEPFLIEVNPRPGATLDVFDDADGTLFAAHVEGARPAGDPAELLAAYWRPPVARAAAFLYADRGALTLGPIAWPPWAADRSRPGTDIANHQPLATVIAEAADPDEAESLCRTRLGILGDLLYEGRKGKETS